ncbi:outer membrane lipoprotein carrier protein LolA [Pseudomonas marginalis ICMP 9505]|uniref:Outer-membrane lipoprotein carrier protein n=1 Tax=Pseudomonas kitaguniensis TaxID=2607908 RepID=A0A5N7JNC6_9PSED|nr:outer membrane lipoprotein chaperone LolA [Pseudomonas kitaguniensis]KTC10919.1 outer membrane lipoprotein carrier protein LolA [Pseudomonas marginalis ICMP 9505]MPQ82890.1 outer membrane lipoprotein chaperone LolA [Pseudomonas kitaguniensis]
MRLIRMLLLPVLALTAVSAHADPASVASLTNLLDKSKTLTARFTQMTLDGGGTQLQQTAGEMAVQRPGLFFWKTDAPNEQTIVSDGQKVTLWDPDLEQATIKKLDPRLNQTPALLLSGDVSKISDSFDITSKQTSNVIEFVLKPKSKDTLFDSLQLSFGNGVINNMRLIDSVGQRTDILFSGVQANGVVDASKFKFVIPKGADVIQE